MRSGAAVPRRYWLYAGVLAGPLAQLGHLVAYSGRYGAAAGPVESAGAHAYFPALARAGIALLACLVLASLLVAGAGRVLLARGLGGRRRAAVPVGDLVLLLGCLQLNVYLVQEVVEGIASGQVITPGSLATIVAWGVGGQVSVALVAGLALHWLSGRFELAPGLFCVRRAAPTPQPLPCSTPLRLPPPPVLPVPQRPALTAGAERAPPLRTPHPSIATV